MIRDKTFFLYTTSECGFCKRAKEKLEEHDLKFIVMELNKDHETLKSLKKEMGWGTVPMIFELDGKNHKFIGGYTDLVAYLGEGDEQR